MSSLITEKMAQAAAAVKLAGADVWLTFVRETAEHADPVLPFLVEGGMTWQSAFMLGRNGEMVAVVGNFDADPLAATGHWDRVVPYVKNIQEALLGELEKLCGPRPRIAVNFSTSDDKSDGLTHGMFRILEGILRGTRFEGAIVSSEEICRYIRGRKTPEELRRIDEALKVTATILDEIEAFAAVGTIEKQIYDHAHTLIEKRGLGYSWDSHQNPIVNSGPDSMIGHGVPSETIKVTPGHIFHIDIGVLFEGYASDIQRSWYVGTQAPAHILKAFDACKDAIQAGFEALKPGIQGWQVDAIARGVLTARGYPEYMHALGHQVGRMAHDGGCLLGPKWERYGDLPNWQVQEGEVYTLELGTLVEGHGYIGLEEMVRVGANGAEWLLAPQKQIRYVGH